MSPDSDWLEIIMRTIRKHLNQRRFKLKIALEEACDRYTREGDRAESVEAQKKFKFFFCNVSQKVDIF